MDKKLLLILVAVLFGAFEMVNAQCIPNPIYADSTFGIWPDTIENLPCGKPNELYETVMEFKNGSIASDIDPTLPSAPITWVRLDSVSGLPSGIGVQTDNPQNQWGPDEQGCATLTGVAAAGIYNLSLHITGEVDVSGFPLQQQLSYGGYILELYAGCVVGLKEVDPTQLTLVNNVPNPFSEETTIRYQLPNSGQLEFIVSDLLGKTVYEEVLSGLKGENKLVFVRNALYPGIYLYQLKHKDQTVTGKMIISGQ